MTPGLLVSRQVMSEFGGRIADILNAAPRRLEPLLFSPEAQFTATQIDGIEASFYSRDIWEGTTGSSLSPAARAYWAIADAAPGLKWLQVVAAGVDQPVYRRSIGRGIRITTSAGTNAEPVGLNAVTGLLMLARGFPHWIRAQQGREWRPLTAPALPPDLPGQTAAIVGVGHIGTVVARALQAMGLRTVGVRQRAAPADYFDETWPLSELDRLLPACDWLVLACPLTTETRRLIDARRLALLPRTAGLVNVARGEIVHEAALVDALAAGRLRGAYLDVFEREPLPPDSPLWTLPNVLLTPHNAAVSTGNYRRGVELFLRNLSAYLRGLTLENEVPRQAGAAAARETKGLP